MFYVGAVEECERKKWEKWIDLSFAAGRIGSLESHLKKRNILVNFFKEGKEKLCQGYFRGMGDVVSCAAEDDWIFPFFCLAQTNWNVSAYNEYGSVLVATKYRKYLYIYLSHSKLLERQTCHFLLFKLNTILPEWRAHRSAQWPPHPQSDWAPSPG